MNRSKLKYYQDSYAGAMNKYGLNRGIDGSGARHVTTQQYYRDLYARNEDLKESIGYLEEQKEEVSGKIWDLYDRKDEAREKFLAMDSHVRQKDKELADIETRLEKARQEYEPYRAQEELNLIHELFPVMKEQLRIAGLCKNIGLAVESIKSLFEGKTLTAKSFPFFSPEHNQKFTAEDVKLKIDNEPDSPNKLRLNLNGVNILEWFRQKYREFQHGTGIRVRQEARKDRGIKM
ncbi:MAG: plasmid recombination protein [Bacteroidales bacterium]|jgi:hypothetical protein|nr:plasmid recombination protein [Bacteroidales bacterium]